MFYFSVAFLIKVFYLQQNWIQQLQFIFSCNTTSLYESHREFPCNSVTASVVILSYADLFIESLFKLWKSYKRLFKLWNSYKNCSNYGTGSLVTQIMGQIIFTHTMRHFLKAMAYTVKIMSVTTFVCGFICLQQEPIEYTKTPIIWQIPILYRY